MNTARHTATEPRYYARTTMHYGLYQPSWTHEVYDSQTGKSASPDTYPTHEYAQRRADYMNNEEYADLYGDIHEHRAEHEPYEPAPDPDIYHHHDQCSCPDCKGR